jgi:hypothetical protein
MDMDPEDAAAFARGDTDPDSDTSQQSMGDLDDAGGGGLSDGPLDRLLDGDAEGPAVGELQADYGFPQWMAVAARGVLRVATGSGVPPVFEILVGSVMGIMRTFGDGGEETADHDGGEGGDGDGDGVPIPAEGGVFGA